MHLTLLGDELPGQDVRDGGVEGDLDALRRRDGDDAAGDVAVGIGAAAMGADGLAAPAGGLADLYMVLVSEEPSIDSCWLGHHVHTILYMGTEP